MAGIIALETTDLSRLESRIPRFRGCLGSRKECLSLLRAERFAVRGSGSEVRRREPPKVRLYGDANPRVTRWPPEPCGLRPR